MELEYRLVLHCFFNICIQESEYGITFERCKTLRSDWFARYVIHDIAIILKSLFFFTLFRPRVWEAAEAIYAENNRTRRGQAAGICWTLGWVVWSKEMKYLDVPTQVWGEWVQGIERVGVSGLGEVGDWNERGFGAIWEEIPPVKSWRRRLEDQGV